VPLSAVIRAVASDAESCPDQLEDVLHLLAPAYNAEIVIFRFEERLVRDDLPHVAGGFEGSEDNLFELGNVERLRR